MRSNNQLNVYIETAVTSRQKKRTEGTKTHEMQLHSRMSRDIAVTRFWD